MVLDRLFGEPQRLADVLIRQALCNTAEHVHLAWGEAFSTALVPDFLCHASNVARDRGRAKETLGELRIDEGIALVDHVDCLDEHIRFDVLEQVAECPVLQHFEHIVIAVVDCERDDLHACACLLQLLRHVQPRQPRHIDIEQEDVGFEHERARQCFLPVLCFSDDLEIVFKIQYALDPLPQERVVVC